jgi:hypothetical protein
MMQIARNLTDVQDGFLNGKRYLLMYRDGEFSPGFQAILNSAGVNTVLLPVQSPNLNAQLERFHRSPKEEWLERMFCFGEASLRNAVRKFLAHYHGERNHQGMGNRILVPGEEGERTTSEVQCRERLGGLLRYLPSACSITADSTEEFHHRCQTTNLCAGTRDALADRTLLGCHRPLRIAALGRNRDIPPFPSLRPRRL